MAMPPRVVPSVVVIGSYAAGLVMRAERIPVPGETVLGRDFQVMDGGKGSNQAVACARLGACTTFVAAIGDDSYGDRALSLYLAEGVDTTYVRRVAGTPTGAGFIIVDDRGNNAIAVDLGANRALSADDIDRAEDAIASADVVVAQMEIPVETALYAMAVARRHGVRTILNPAPARPLPASAMTTIDILTPNLSEARILCGLDSTDDAALSKKLLASGIGTIVLTLGERGALITDECGMCNIAACHVEPVDTTGAGDAFSAALAVALAEGSGLQDAAAFACAAGAYSTLSLGTVPSYATRSELKAFTASTS
jgi:ribokinase